MLDWYDVFKVSIPVLLAALVWLLNEYSKRRWEQYKRKEHRYVALLDGLEGFYVGADPETAKAKKAKFIHQLSIAWLYCPDTVITKANEFLEYVKVGVQKSDEEKEMAAGELVICMRKDLLKGKPWLAKRTQLRASCYQHFRAT